MIGPITVVIAIFLTVGAWWLLKNKIPVNFFGKFKILKNGGLDLGKISSILVGWVILHIVIMLSLPNVWTWYIGQTRLFISVQIMAITISLLIIFGGKLGSYMSIGIVTVVAFGFATAILQEQKSDRQTVAHSTTSTSLKRSSCGEPKIIIATSKKWSDPVKARVGCDWIIRTDENAGLENARLCFKTRINKRSNLVFTECGTGIETHLSKNLIARKMEFRSMGKPVQLKINFVPKE